MKPAVVRASTREEFFSSDEVCYITEAWNSPDDEMLSIAVARVEAGVTTTRHALDGVSERYVVIEGVGRVEVGDVPPTVVGPGDVVVIPPGTPQRITNDGPGELRFYCLCTPRFQPSCRTTI